MVSHIRAGYIRDQGSDLAKTGEVSFCACLGGWPRFELHVDEKVGGVAGPC